MRSSARRRLETTSNNPAIRDLAEMDESGWCLTESDPQVFTQLLRDLGVQGLQVVSLTVTMYAELLAISNTAMCL